LVFYLPPLYCKAEKDKKAELYRKGRPQSRRHKPPQAAVEGPKPQAATKFLSHAGENVSRKSRKPAQLKAISFKGYQLITKLIRIMDNM